MKIEENCQGGQECFRHPSKREINDKKENYMKKNNDETSEGLNQIFEIINAKGDTGELREIVEQTNESTSQDEQQRSEWKGLDLSLGFFVDKTEQNVDR